MKRLMSTVFIVLIVVLSSGAAGAPGIQYHDVKKDENVSVVAKKYGLGYKEVARANKLKPPYIIHPGDRLIIPTASAKKKARGFRKGGLSRWIFPGQNKFFGGCDQAGGNPKNIKFSLRRQLRRYGNKYDSLITTFERRIDNRNYEMRSIEQGEYFNSMEFTRGGKVELVQDLIVNWDMDYVKKNNIPSEAERYTEKFGNEEVIFTVPRACCNPAIRIKRLPFVPPPPPLKEPPKTFIIVKKEALDIKDNPIDRVPQFTFKLNGGVEQEKNDSSGEAIFEVQPGEHLVTEVEEEGWMLERVTPPGGRVKVKEGQTVTVFFKNRQTLTPRPEPTPIPVPTPSVTPTIPEKPVTPGEPEPIETEPKIEMDRWELESEFNGVLGQWKRTGGRLGDLDLKGNFFSADETVWYHSCEKCSWRWGIGFIAGYDDWKADFGRGRGYRAGSHVGGKFFETTGENNYRLGEFKIRPFTFEVQKFRAKFSGDKSVQRSIVPELRLGYEVGEVRNYRSFKPERFGVFFNLRVPIHRDKNSNFVTREDGLSTVMGGIWGQWKLVNSPNLALRVTAAPFYQQWDKQTGIFTGATLRYEGPIDLMVGPFVNFFPFRPGSGQLIGWAGQIELRNAVQFTYRKYRERQLTQVDAPPAESIKAFEDDALGDPDEEKEISESSEKVRKEIRTLERDVEQKVEHLVLVRSSWPEDSTGSQVRTAAFETEGDPEIANQDFHPDLD